MFSLGLNNFWARWNEKSDQNKLARRVECKKKKICARGPLSGVQADPGRDFPPTSPLSRAEADMGRDEQQSELRSADLEDKVDIFTAPLSRPVALRDLLFQLLFLAT